MSLQILRNPRVSEIMFKNIEKYSNFCYFKDLPDSFEISSVPLRLAHTTILIIGELAVN
jgi:hypothetical protein